MCKFPSQAIALSSSTPGFLDLPTAFLGSHLSLLPGILSFYISDKRTHWKSLLNVIYRNLEGDICLNGLGQMGSYTSKLVHHWGFLQKVPYVISKMPLQVMVFLRLTISLHVLVILNSHFMEVFLSQLPQCVFLTYSPLFVLHSHWRPHCFIEVICCPHD